MEAKRKCYNIFLSSTERKKKCWSQLPYPVKMSCQNEGKIFSCKVNLREFVTSKPTLKDWLNRKEMKTEGLNFIKERRTSTWIKGVNVSIILLLILLSYLMLEIKSITPYNVVFNIHGENTWDN